MKSYFLSDYNLSYRQIVQSFVLSEYGLRHLQASKKRSKTRWGHRFIAVVELCPLIGLIVSIIERILVGYRNRSHAKKASQQRTISFFNGSQEECEGWISREQAEKIRFFLQNRAEPGIRFNKNKIPVRLEGGTCSVMALQFADIFFKLFQDRCWDKVTERIEKIKKYFLKSSMNRRNIQAAFNTIEVIHPLEKHDYLRNKVASMANLYRFKINLCSPEIEIDKIEKTPSYQRIIENLKKGVYFVRLVKIMENDKLEEKGHSFIYVKTKELSLFYDPNGGPVQFPATQTFKVLAERLKIVRDRFQVPTARFYRLVPKDVPV